MNKNKEEHELNKNELRINRCQEWKSGLFCSFVEIWLFREQTESSRRLWYISLFSVDFLYSSWDFCSALTFVFMFSSCTCARVSVYQFVSVLCCRTGENKSPAVVLISSSFVSVLRDQLSVLCLPLQLHLLQTIITPFKANASQTADRRPTTGSTGRQKRVFRTKSESERVFFRCSTSVTMSNTVLLSTGNMLSISVFINRLTATVRGRGAKITEHELTWCRWTAQSLL